MEESFKQDVQESSEARASFYRFLSSVYLKELTDEQIEDLAHRSYPDDGSLMAQGYAMIFEYLRHRDSGTRQELAVDYAHTFLSAGTYERLVAPPYESVFTSAQQLLMQEARDGAVKSYRAEGLALPIDNTTPEDHLGFELQFMALLVDRAAEALESGDEGEFFRLVRAQDDFLSKHLGNWIPAFAKAIDKNARTDFYRGIGMLTEGFVRLERELIDEMLAVVAVEAA